MNRIGKYIASAYNNSPCSCHKATGVHVIHTISAPGPTFMAKAIHCNSNIHMPNLNVYCHCTLGRQYTMLQ